MKMAQHSLASRPHKGGITALTWEHLPPLSPPTVVPSSCSLSFLSQLFSPSSRRPPCLCKVICRGEDYCSPSWWPWLGWRDAYTDEDECSYSLAEVCLFQGTLALMTWLIGCPKSGGALINHLTDWIQSSASPAQWWTGKDTAQVLTRVHSHHRWQRRRRPTSQENEGTYVEEETLFLCDSQCQAANRWLTGDTASATL